MHSTNKIRKFKQNLWQNQMEWKLDIIYGFNDTNDGNSDTFQKYFCAHNSNNIKM